MARNPTQRYIDNEKSKSFLNNENGQKSRKMLKKKKYSKKSNKFLKQSEQLLKHVEK